MKMHNSNKQYSGGESVGALTQIYLELGLPLQFALRAAEADLCYREVQKSAKPPWPMAAISND